MSDAIIPNANPHLAVLTVWASPLDGLENVEEFPIIAWRLVEGEAPIPISTDGDPGRNEGVRDWMIYDRASQLGHHADYGNTYTREACVKLMQCEITNGRARKAVK